MRLKSREPKRPRSRAGSCAIGLSHAPTPNIDWSRYNVWISVGPSGAPGQAQPTFPITILGTNGRALEAAVAGFAHTNPPEGTAHNRGWN